MFRNTYQFVTPTSVIRAVGEKEPEQILVRAQ
jgi:hypothetical protein